VGGELAVDGGVGGRVDRQYELCGRLVGACDPGYLEIVINNVKAVGVPGDLVRVKKVRELSGIFHAEAIFAAGKPGDGSGPEQALKVEYGIEPAAAQISDERYKSGDAAALKPCLSEHFAVEKDDVVQVGMILNERRELGPDEPTDFGVRKTVSQGGQGGQGEDDIAK